MILRFENDREKFLDDSAAQKKASRLDAQVNRNSACTIFSEIQKAVDFRSASNYNFVAQTKYRAQVPSIALSLQSPLLAPTAFKFYHERAALASAMEF